MNDFSKMELSGVISILSVGMIWDALTLFAPGQEAKQVAVDEGAERFRAASPFWGQFPCSGRTITNAEECMLIHP